MRSCPGWPYIPSKKKKEVINSMNHIFVSQAFFFLQTFCKSSLKNVVFFSYKIICFHCLNSRVAKVNNRQGKHKLILTKATSNHWPWEASPVLDTVNISMHSHSKQIRIVGESDSFYLDKSTYIEIWIV